MPIAVVELLYKLSHNYVCKYLPLASVRTWLYTKVAIH